ncbi:protein sym-1 [Diospyros lotus]|uniref:protein sym-1 n=1 Tax=Diospyros lotus TaxID=55363 RepID=UPI002251AB45|nr:protein sym-1 [Diospyros lotus]XP_052175148.1 protein sym-1 [Diospyros lotus]XP_052175149.1 protein sym-1 [Diospyros lotus]XP_052175150.1 protein sym-1 [Diospyros lotus]
MVPNSATITRISSPLFRFARFSSRPPHKQVEIPPNPFRISGIGSSSSWNFRPLLLNYSRRLGVFKDMDAADGRYRLLDADYFRVSAVSGGGSGGNGGYGSSGGGNSGGKGEGAAGDGAHGGGRSNWSFLSWYLTLLEKHPVLTKAITSAFLTFIGDFICQVMVDQVPSLDVKRIFLFTLLGLVLVGPTLHFWYLYLSKLVTLPGASGAFLRLLLDQFLFSPAFIGVFLSTLVTLEGRPSQVVPKLQQEWFSAVLANWQLWIPFQFLNFRFVPQQFQVLAANFIALIWNVILSYKAHKEVLAK